MRIWDCQTIERAIKLAETEGQCVVTLDDTALAGRFRMAVYNYRNRTDSSAGRNLTITVAGVDVILRRIEVPEATIKENV